MTFEYVALGGIAAFVILAVLAAWIVTKVGNARREKENRTSLTDAGADQSEFSARLVERYRNQNN